jgi:hypothetical protein
MKTTDRPFLIATLTTGLSLLPLATHSLAQEEPSPAPEPVLAENQESELSAEEAVTADPIADTSEVEEVKQEASYADPSIDHAVAKALLEQGYFSAASDDDKENFMNALKNFQTLNGLSPTGEITPEVLQKLGVGESQFSPE